MWRIFSLVKTIILNLVKIHCLFTTIVSIQIEVQPLEAGIIFGDVITGLLI